MSRWSRGGRSTTEQGFSLIESLIAMMLLTIGALAIVGVLTDSVTTLRDSRLRQQATAAATRSIEVAREYPWAQLGMRQGDPGIPPGPYDSGCSPPCPESIVALPDGLVAGPIHQDNSKGLHVQTVVTEVAGMSDARRVTVTVTWTAKQATRHLRQSTIVAKATRSS